MRATVPRLDGNYAFCAVSADEPRAHRRHAPRAPLVVGLGDGEIFVASAIPAFLGHTREVMVLSDGDVAAITRRRRRRDRPSPAPPSSARRREVTWDADAAEKGGYETFMLKEIHEQPRGPAPTRWPGGCATTARSTSPRSTSADELLRRMRRVLIIACGTSFHAGLIASYAMEQLHGLPVQVDLASEFRYRDPVLDDEILVIGITQSGETARHARRHASRARGRRRRCSP